MVDLLRGDLNRRNLRVDFRNRSCSRLIHTKRRALDFPRTTAKVVRLGHAFCPPDSTDFRLGFSRLNLLEVTRLVKQYGPRRVVDEVTFHLEQKQIAGLLGRNGAGKTTTFRMILGMVVPESGAVAFDGQDVTELPMYQRARRKLGYLPQERSDFRRLTVWQNLMAVLETISLTLTKRF